MDCLQRYEAIKVTCFSKKRIDWYLVVNGDDPHKHSENISRER